MPEKAPASRRKKEPPNEGQKNPTDYTKQHFMSGRNAGPSDAIAHEDIDKATEDFAKYQKRTREREKVRQEVKSYEAKLRGKLQEKDNESMTPETQPAPAPREKKSGNVEVRPRPMKPIEGIGDIDEPEEGEEQTSSEQPVEHKEKIPEFQDKPAVDVVEVKKTVTTQRANLNERFTQENTCIEKLDEVSALMGEINELYRVEREAEMRGQTVAAKQFKETRKELEKMLLADRTTLAEIRKGTLDDNAEPPKIKTRTEIDAELVARVDAEFAKRLPEERGGTEVDELREAHPEWSEEKLKKADELTELLARKYLTETPADEWEEAGKEIRTRWSASEKMTDAWEAAGREIKEREDKKSKEETWEQLKEVRDANIKESDWDIDLKKFQEGVNQVAAGRKGVRAETVKEKVTPDKQEKVLKLLETLSTKYRGATWKQKLAISATLWGIAGTGLLFGGPVAATLFGISFAGGRVLSGLAAYGTSDSIFERERQRRSLIGRQFKDRFDVRGTSIAAGALSVIAVPFTFHAIIGLFPSIPWNDILLSLGISKAPVSGIKLPGTPVVPDPPHGGGPQLPPGGGEQPPPQTPPGGGTPPHGPGAPAHGSAFSKPIVVGHGRPFVSDMIERGLKENGVIDHSMGSAKIKNIIYTCEHALRALGPAGLRKIGFSSGNVDKIYEGERLDLSVLDSILNSLKV